MSPSVAVESSHCGLSEVSEKFFFVVIENIAVLLWPFVICVGYWLSMIF